MSNEINYEIDNCITDLDTLKILEKRAVRDLENNTHEIQQQDVLTIIREFIRLRNDYNKEKEKNLIFKGATIVSDLEKDGIEIKMNADKLVTLYLEEKEKNKELENADLTTVYMNGFYDGEKKWKDKIKQRINEIDDTGIRTFNEQINMELKRIDNQRIEDLQELLKERN